VTNFVTAVDGAGQPVVYAVSIIVLLQSAIHQKHIFAVRGSLEARVEMYGIGNVGFHGMTAAIFS